MKFNPFKLERFFAQYEFTAPYLLCTSDCESFTIKELLSFEENSQTVFENLSLGYTDTQGNPALRKEISNLYNSSNIDNILTCTGAEEGIFVFMNALLTSHDHIIIQSPCYQSLYEIANSIGCSITQWPMNPSKQWELDPDFLEKSITPRTKAIIINFPNNPTGYLISNNPLNRIVEIARKYDIYIFSDEVYRFLEYDEKDRLPALCDIYEKAVSLGVMSKAFGLPGLRIGWVVTSDKKLHEEMASIKDYTTICNSAPSEFLATLALHHKEIILNRNLEILSTNLSYLRTFFAKYNEYFEWVPPIAGPIIFPRIKFTSDADVFCGDLVEKQGVLLAPGSMFSFNKDYVRFGFGRKNMPQVLKHLEEYLELYIKRKEL